MLTHDKLKSIIKGTAAGILIIGTAALVTTGVVKAYNKIQQKAEDEAYKRLKSEQVSTVPTNTTINNIGVQNNYNINSNNTTVVKPVKSAGNSQNSNLENTVKELNDNIKEPSSELHDLKDEKKKEHHYNYRGRDVILVEGLRYNYGGRDMLFEGINSGMLMFSYSNRRGVSISYGSTWGNYCNSIYGSGNYYHNGWDYGIGNRTTTMPTHTERAIDNIIRNQTH